MHKDNVKTVKVNPKSIVKSQQGPSALTSFRTAEVTVRKGFREIALAVKNAKSPTTLAAIKSFLDREVKKVAEDVSKEIRGRLMEVVEQKGETVNQSTSVMRGRIGEVTYAVKRQEIRAAVPEIQALQALLAQKNIDPLKVHAVVPVTTYEVNMEVVNQLIEQKKLTAEEVYNLRPLKQVNLTVEKE